MATLAGPPDVGDLMAVLDTNQAKRLAEIDKRCREYRTKQVKKTRKLTKQVLAKSPKKKVVKSKYFSPLRRHTTENVDSGASSDTYKNVKQLRKSSIEERKARAMGKTLLGLSKVKVFAKKIQKKGLKMSQQLSTTFACLSTRA